MAYTLNKAMLIGNLGKDAEKKYTTQGLAILSFSIATSQNTKDKDGNWKADTTWHDIKCFGEIAEKMETLLRKGKKVYVEGRINKNSYVDRENIKRWSFDIIANQIILLDKAETEFVPQHNTTHPTEIESPVSNEPEEDLPF